MGTGDELDAMLDDDSFIVEDNEVDEFRDICLPPAVASLLRYRTALEEREDSLQEREDKLPPPRKVARLPRKFEPELCSDVRSSFESSCASPNIPINAVHVETYLDLKDYDMSYRENKSRQLGSLRLIYSFYSRLYDKLIGKQMGKDVPFFSPELPPESRKFGFREVMNFHHDFGLQSIIFRRDLEAYFLAVVNLPSQAEVFQSGMTFDEFIDFIALLSLSDEANNLPEDTLCQRSGKFARKMAFNRPKEMKGQLWNAWRDIHFWRLREDEPFEKTARMESILALPKRKVKAVHPKMKYQQPGWGTLRRYLRQFEYIDTGPLWERFDKPIVDMGISLIGQNKSFKIILRNLRHHVMRFNFEVENMGPVRMPIPDVATDGLGPGQSCTIPLEPFVQDEGEFAGKLRIIGTTAAKEVYPFEIPVYMRACFPHEGEGFTGKELPSMAPQPFRKVAELSYPIPTESAKHAGAVPRCVVQIVHVATPAYRTFIVDVCSNSNLNPRQARLYGRPLSASKHRPRSAPMNQAHGSSVASPVALEAQRPTTAPAFRTIRDSKETPRSARRRPRSAQPTPTLRKPPGSRPPSAHTVLSPTTYPSKPAGAPFVKSSDPCELSIHSAISGVTERLTTTRPLSAQSRHQPHPISGQSCPRSRC
eukprot:GEMP01021096.1.p1 GENE.GEMP01021096.1~~GEMP01021096.1.p1  ORF type:complete len:650 (+),score=126.32 GEMP01021096.1:17-1966(+)